MNKDADAFRTISEVAEELDLPQHVLRFWETRFKQIRPMKRGGGRRYYRPDDVALLRGIKGLLYSEGYTIRGVQRLLKEYGNRVAIEFGKSGELDLVASQIDGPSEGAGQAARQVGDLEKEMKGKNKGPGILGRIASRAVAGSNQTNDAPHISASDISALQSTLQELLECKRLLDQTRQN